MKNIFARFSPSALRRKAFVRHLNTPKGRKVAADFLAARPFRSRSVLTAKEFATSALRTPRALRTFISAILERGNGVRIVVDELTNSSAGMSLLAKRMVAAPHFLSALVANKAFLRALFTQGRAFDYWLDQVVKNPEATYRVVSHPDFVARLSAQSELVTSLGKAEVLLALIDVLPPESKAFALKRLLTQEDDLLESMVLRSAAPLQKALLTNPAIRDVVLAEVCSAQSLDEVVNLLLHDTGFGSSSSERLSNFFEKLLNSPPVIQALRRDAEVRQATVKAVLNTLQSLGCDPLEDVASVVYDEISRFPGAAVSFSQIDDPNLFKILDNGVSVAKAIKLVAPHLSERKPKKNPPLRYSKSGDLRAYLKSIAPNNVLETGKGPFKFLDAKGLATIVDEILVNEEYYCDLGEGAYVIDAGANVGLATFYIKTKFPTATVLAFEPAPHLAALVRQNVEACNLDKVEVREMAVSASGGDLELIIDNANSLAGSLTTRQTGKSNDLERVVVSTVALSDLLDRPVDFLKLDIEGVEFDAIMAAEDRIKQVHYLFCEYHADQKENRDRLGLLLQHLTDKGFSYHISKSSWAENRFRARPLTYAHRGVSYGIYAVNSNWPEKLDA